MFSYENKCAAVSVKNVRKKSTSLSQNLNLGWDRKLFSGVKIKQNHKRPLNDEDSWSHVQLQTLTDGSSKSLY